MTCSMSGGENLVCMYEQHEAESDLSDGAGAVWSD